MRITEVDRETQFFELDSVERFADNMFGKIALMWSLHASSDRVNDERNVKPQITVSELVRLSQTGIQTLG